MRYYLVLTNAYDHFYNVQTEELLKILLHHLGHKPTGDQQKLLSQLSHFIISAKSRCAYVIRGYAGTGKTTLIGSLVKALPVLKMKSVLLAPTGRAAKVISGYSGKKAFTIHKIIYQLKSGADGYTRFVLRPNPMENTVFVVDEASMIGTSGGLTSKSWGETRSLLDDLMEFVYSGENCKLILIGDSAQLPPVGMEMSFALDPEYLKRNYSLTIAGFELKKVVRQKSDSGILHNATLLRNNINEDEPEIHFDTEGFEDVIPITGLELEDALNDAYGEHGEDNTMVITRSNKRANLFNLQIRSRVRWLEDEIATGDYMMVVRNNYHWLDATSKAGFIANGDIVEVLNILRTEELYGFRFADVNIRMVDYPGEPHLEVKILLDTIMAEQPSLSSDKSKLIYENIMMDYQDIPDKKKRLKKLKENPYYQALQVKFAYAVTCHKAQGGQWKSVFVEQGYLTDEMIDKNYQRWLYTALTRATEKLYLVNFHEKFYE